MVEAQARDMERYVRQLEHDTEALATEMQAFHLELRAAEADKQAWAAVLIGSAGQTRWRAVPTYAGIDALHP